VVAVVAAVAAAAIAGKQRSIEVGAAPPSGAVFIFGTARCQIGTPAVFLAHDAEPRQHS